ncbi:MAG: hypothetical protein FJW31_15815 [Acidobacteria bacterium]|nr:hypothetical protein [Acidobacteriota bacterium]
MKQAVGLLLLPLALSAAAEGQSATPRGFGELAAQAPPHIDQALRARVQAFYDLQQAKKYRQSETLVHEDSKDIFYGAEKLTFRNFKIVGVTFEEQFTRAKVVIDIDTDVFFPGFGQMAVHRPLASSWKLDQEQWWWFVTATNVKASPFGPMNFGDGQLASGPKTQGPAAPAPPILGNIKSMENFPEVMKELRSKVTADKDAVTLPSNQAGEAVVLLFNKFDNKIKPVITMPDKPGLKVVLDPPVVPSGEQGRIRIIATPVAGTRPPVSVRITVEEIAKTFPIEVTFQPAPGK